jgi:uncharacterized membrane protein YphA (DoxX/SURF4 family)
MVSSLTSSLPNLVARLRQRRWAQLVVANLRIFIGFALLPAGLKKVLGEPFTDPGTSGPFHDFLHAFHATGAFYTVVGAIQLVTALLLMTQRFATIGALMALPIFTVILAFCWSTAVYPTASVVTLIFLGTVALVLWDWAAWRPLLSPSPSAPASPTSPTSPTSPASPTRPDAAPAVSTRVWGIAGLGVALAYLCSCALQGGVYRPRGMELDNPAFYLFPVLLAFPIGAAIVDRRRYRAARGATG